MLKCDVWENPSVRWIEFMLACALLTFPVRSNQINSLHYVSRSSTPCLDLWGISSRFLACICPFFPPCGFISCLDLLDFLWMSRRCWWSRHCVANSVGDGQSWKTENGNGPTRRSLALTGLSGGEARLRRMFTIFILNNRVLGSWDKTQSRLWTITQPLLWSEITKDRGNTGISSTIVLKFTYTMKLKHT